MPPGDRAKISASAADVPSCRPTPAAATFKPLLPPAEVWPAKVPHHQKPRVQRPGPIIPPSRSTVVEAASARARLPPTRVTGRARTHPLPQTRPPRGIHRATSIVCERKRLASAFCAQIVESLLVLPRWLARSIGYSLRPHRRAAPQSPSRRYALMENLSV